MSDALSFVFTCITSAVNWLLDWRFLGIPFLAFLIAFAILCIILDRVF